MNVERFAKLRALKSREEFLATLGCAAVLVRLDERGGRDEPSPWAFLPGKRRVFSFEPRADEEVDTEMLRSVLSEDTHSGGGESSDVFTANAADETVTVARPRYPIPPARGVASVYQIHAEPVCVVGRGEGSDLIIPERSISKRHAEFRRLPDDNGYELRDACSSNGTSINNRSIKEQEARLIKDGDVLTFGDISCVFLEVSTFYEQVSEFMD